MKILLILFLVLASIGVAQTAQHSATLTWADATNPTGTTYSVYRATGLCSGTPTFAKLATAITVKTFVDSTVTPGNYCYVATASFGGVESSFSNTAVAAVPTFAPTALSVTVQ